MGGGDKGDKEQDKRWGLPLQFPRPVCASPIKVRGQSVRTDTHLRGVPAGLQEPLWVGGRMAEKENNKNQ